MQRIGLIAVLAVAAYLLVMVIMPPEDNPAESPLARPQAPAQPAAAQTATGQAGSKTDPTPHP